MQQLNDITSLSIQGVSMFPYSRLHTLAFHLYLFIFTLYHYFLKICFIDYAITVVQIFPPLPSSTQYPSLHPAIAPVQFMAMGRAYKSLGFSISYTAFNLPLPILYLPTSVPHSPTSHFQMVTTQVIFMILFLL